MRRISIVVLVALLLPVAGCRCGRGKPPTQPEQRIEELMARGHSPLLGSREPLDEIRRDFGSYEKLLREELAIPADLRDLVGERQDRFTRALAILLYVDTPESAALIAEMLRRIVPYLRQIWAQPPRDGKPPPVEEAMFFAFVGGIGSLKTQPAFVEDAFALLETEPVPEPTARLNVIQYLARVGASDPQVVKRMRALLDNKTSPVRDDPHLQKYVEHLEK